MRTLVVRRRSFHPVKRSPGARAPLGRDQLKRRKRHAHTARDATNFYMKDQNKIIGDLIETLKDGQEGFKQAAEGVKDPQLKSLFDEYSRQRARFAVELRSKVQSPDKRESEMTGSAAGALHRGWINLKSAVTRGDDHAILAECERGEDSAVEEFSKALDNGLSAPVQEIVSRQCAEIKQAHDRVKHLRDASKKS
jgi:uncharacterized protein (TIGR02284 family)